MRKIGIFLLVFVLVGCNQVKRQQRQYYEYFDTNSTLIAYQQNFEEMGSYVEQRLVYYHQLFDIYHQYPGVINVASLNNRVESDFVVSKDLYDFLAFGLECYHKSKGIINIGAGSLLSVWHDSRTADNNQLPSIVDLNVASEHIDLNSMVLNEEALKVTFSDPLLRLDVGALAKGYAVEKIVNELKLLNYNNFLFSSGGNVASVGYKDNNKLWVVGIESPFDTTQLLAQLQLTQYSVVTSGDYQRYYIVDNESYCHIIDPFTLYPASHYRSVSVISDSSMMADYYSTLLFILPKAEALELVEADKSIEACFVFADGSIVYSSGFSNFQVK